MAQLEGTVRYIGAMRDLRPAILSALLISSGLLFSSLLPGCSTPAPAQPESAPPPDATPAVSEPGEPAAPAEPAPPAQPADAKPAPAETVDIRGRVTQARRNGQGELPVGTLQVEGALEPGTRYAKATIHVGHQTKIFLGRSGPGQKPASFSFIHSGDLIEVIFVGPPTGTTETTESDPVKATADRIVILEHTP
jgi:nucleoid-associated protein YgaU